MYGKRNPAAVATASGVGIVDLAVCGSVPKQPSPKSGRTPSPAPTVNIIALRLLAKNRWQITLEGGDVVLLSSAELQTFKRFSRAAMSQVNRVFADMRPDEWLALINAYLQPPRDGGAS